MRLFLYILCSMLLVPVYLRSLEEVPKLKVLIASPVRQKPTILSEFLVGLQQLQSERCIVDYFFIDDNTDEQSSVLLKKFIDRANSASCLYKSQEVGSEKPYICNNVTHYWTDDLIWKVAAFKDTFIAHARALEYDYLFLVDSDIVLHPKTLQHLIDTKKDIVATIFWTEYRPGAPAMPQVWLADEYTLYDKKRDEQLTDYEVLRRTEQYFRRLRTPGLYPVGGLGACTLISKKALQVGVCFKKIDNLTFWGEDRHFCVRAVALGLSLYVDTHFPAYHIYRESDLLGLEAYKQK